MTEIALSKGAESDLRSIIRFTRKTWGERQVVKYRKRINSTLASIANKDLPDKLFSRNLEGIFYAKLGSHFVFYVRPNKQNTIFVAFLHSRSEVIKHLQNRL